MSDSNQLEPEIKKAIDGILDKDGFVFHRATVNLKRTKGDGFIASIQRIEVEKKHKNGDVAKEKLSLVIKKEPLNLKKRNEFETPVLFDREILVYELFLPTVKHFLKEKESTLGKELVEHFIIAPNYFTTVKIDDSLAIILEDMKTYGYKMAPRRMNLNQQWCKTILERLARFHACSFALKDQKPEVFSNLKEKMWDIMLRDKPLADCDKYINAQSKALVQLLSDCFDPDSIYMTKLKEHSNNAYEKLKNRISGFRNSRPNYGVICQGDCWVNNMLFKYTEDSVDEVCILDYQASRWGCAITDISTLICVCSDLNTFLNLKELMEHYYNHLSSSIKLLGSDPNVLIPKSEFQEQVKTLFVFGFILATCNMQMVMSDDEDIPDVHDSEMNVKMFDQFVDIKCKDQSAVKNHLKSMLCYAVDNDLL